MYEKWVTTLRLFQSEKLQGGGGRQQSSDLHAYLYMLCYYWCDSFPLCCTYLVSAVAMDGLNCWGQKCALVSAPTMCVHCVCENLILIFVVKFWLWLLSSNVFHTKQSTLTFSLSLCSEDQFKTIRPMFQRLCEDRKMNHILNFRRSSSMLSSQTAARTESHETNCGSIQQKNIFCYA